MPVSKKKKVIADGVGQQGNWLYSNIVKKHFFQPQNIMMPGAEEKFKANGVGYVGSPACGDMMKVFLKIDPKTERVKKFKWQTFGCASAIASTSMLSVMATEKGGMKIDQALKIRPQDIMARLGGLPDRKVHCSVLGDKALRAAINDYFKKTEQYDRVVTDGAKVIDAVLKVTDHDIEEAVLSGADSLEKVQEKTKVGLGDPTCLPEVEQLIRFYREKYFGI